MGNEQSEWRGPGVTSMHRRALWGPSVKHVTIVTKEERSLLLEG